MKAVINIEIMDDTSAETCAAHGMTMDKLHDMYTKGFAEILRHSVHPDAKWELLVHVVDNTKQGGAAWQTMTT